jgi:hypothetical protein
LAAQSGEGKRGKRRGEGGGFIGRVLMAINSREVSGDGELRPATVSSGGGKRGEEDGPGRWVPPVSQRREKKMGTGSGR